MKNNCHYLDEVEDFMNEISDASSKCKIGNKTRNSLKEKASLKKITVTKTSKKKDVKNSLLSQQPAPSKIKVSKNTVAKNTEIVSKSKKYIVKCSNIHSGVILKFFWIFAKNGKEVVVFSMNSTLF